MKATPLLVVRLLSGFLPAAAAETVTVHETRRDPQQQYLTPHEVDSPFLSATLKTEISPVSAAVNQRQIDALSSALVSFFAKVFREQEAYDVAIVGLAIFEESLSEANRDGRRGLVLNALQAHQFTFDENDPNARFGRDDDRFGRGDDDDGGDGRPWDDEGAAGDDYYYDGGDGYTLTFATVVSAEHTQRQTLSHADFQKMLVHVCHKFADHLVDYVTGIDDAYFANVESVAVSGYEDLEQGDVGAGTNAPGDVVEGSNAAGDEAWDEDKEGPEGLNTTASIAGVVVVATLAFASLVFSSKKMIQYYRRRRQREENNRWRTQQIATANSSSIKSLSVLNGRLQEDDWSFNPLGTSSGYRDKTSIDYDNADGGFDDRIDSHIASSLEQLEVGGNFRPRKSSEETVLFTNPPQVAFPPSPSIFPSSSLDESTEKRLSSLKTPQSSGYGQQQHVFAPPGKVGVAIDVVDGRPVVHRVKKGSPLEGLLRPNDQVLAIDDVDTTSMTAADVTSLMVKRMNYGRKITFARAGG